MNFLSQIFTFDKYYFLFKILFNRIGYNYYKGLNGKLPPIRYLGTDIYNNELVVLVHPKDFIPIIKDLKIIYNNLIKLDSLYKFNNIIKLNQLELFNNFKNNNINIINKITEIYEILPSVDELFINPNGFIALFVNKIGIDILKQEFNKNMEINRLKFIKIDYSYLKYYNINRSNVLNIFLSNFNKKEDLINKYKNLYLTIGELNNFDIITNKKIPSNIYNILGGKRLYYENSIDCTIRETIEELGLSSQSNIINIIKYLLLKTKDIINCNTFNVYCIYFTPNIIDYNNYIKNNIYYLKDNLIKSSYNSLVNINDI